MIEPISGRTISLKYNLQLNTAILDQYISSPRSPSYNISYKQSQNDVTLTKPFPICWISINVVPANDQLTIFNKVSAKGHCTKSFPSRISSVNVTKSTVSYEFDHIF